MGFDVHREIVAGNTLVAEAIQSQNFVTGVSGWQIAANGNAEFNDAIFRGEVDVVNSDLGTSVILSPLTRGIEFGTGPYDGPGTPVQHNGTIQGIAFGSSPNRSGRLLLTGPHPDSTDAPLIDMESGNVEGTHGSSILLSGSGGSTAVTIHGSLDTQNPTLIADIANPTGGLVTGAITTLSLSGSSTNVGAMWSAGTDITIPVGEDGDYDIVLNLNYATNVTGIRQGRVNVNGTSFFAWNQPALTGFNTTVCGVICIPGLVGGDKLTIGGFQNSGGALSITGKNTIKVARRYV